MKKLAQTPWLLVALLALVSIVACKKDKLEVTSDFSFNVDATDFKKVAFTNASQNQTSVSWDFGDGTSSTELNPVHSFPGGGVFIVKLTAKGDDGIAISTKTLTLADPNAELTKLVGDVSKTWKLLRQAGSRWPLQVGPIDRSQIWWAQGLGNDEIALRPCIMNDEWTFGRDGSMRYDSKGDYWAEGGVFATANVCQTTSPANMIGVNGEDNSAFGDGNHTYVLGNGATSLEVKGLGAFVGLCKIGTDREVTTPQTSVKLNIVKLSDGAVDTLVLESLWKFANNTSNNPDGYWRVVLVHYDNPADEPALPSPKPATSFTVATDGLTAVFTNTSQFATSYLWEFGDGSTSTEFSPTHTYADAGLYTAKLTATNSAGSSIASQDLTMTTGGPMTEADLLGGGWKVRNAATSIFVGPGLGSSAWYSVPANFLDGTSTGIEDWSCITDDEFIFSTGGVFEYKTNGSTRNDGYMGTPVGCWSDAEIAASGNGAAFGSGVHSFTFTPAGPGTRPIITLTNGASGAAFLGFHKGYYGGENTNNANAPNGGSPTNRYEVISYVKASGQEILTVSVDISAAKDGSAAWSAVLVR